MRVFCLLRAGGGGRGSLGLLTLPRARVHKGVGRQVWAVPHGGGVRGCVHFLYFNQKGPNRTVTLLAAIILPGYNKSRRAARVKSADDCFPHSPLEWRHAQWKWLPHRRRRDDHCISAEEAVGRTPTIGSIASRAQNGAASTGQRTAQHCSSRYLRDREPWQTLRFCPVVSATLRRVSSYDAAETVWLIHAHPHCHNGALPPSSQQTGQPCAPDWTLWLPMPRITAILCPRAKAQELKPKS